MLVLKSVVDPKACLARAEELIELGKNPEDLARTLLMSEEVDRVNRGVKATSLKGLIDQIEKVIDMDHLDAAIEEAQSPSGLRKLLKQGPDTDRIEKLKGKRQALGEEWQAMGWYYKHDRVWLAACVRDMAMEAGLQPDAVWIEISEEADYAPSAHLFEKRLLSKAQTFIDGLGGKFHEIKPEFLLQSVDGHRSLHFDMEERTLTYLTAVKG
jgi:hypothetical protein